MLHQYASRAFNIYSCLRQPNKCNEERVLPRTPLLAKSPLMLRSSLPYADLRLTSVRMV
jgi:hypothetical protein